MTGSVNVGGIAGGSYLGSTIEGCHSTAAVSGISSVGGVVGNLGNGCSLINGQGTVTACYWDNNQSSGIGEDQTGKGETTKVEGSTTWETAMNAMNAALTNAGWQYVTGSGDAPLTLRKQ